MLTGNKDDVSLSRPRRLTVRLSRTIVFIGCLGLTVTAWAQEDPKKLQGTWSVVSAERDGKPSDEYKQFFFTFTGDRFILKGPELDREGAVKIDASRKPKHITLSPVSFKAAMQGIYEFEKETLKLCLGDLGKDRPAEFTTKPGSPAILFILRREKP
jgi:uncharacterized protein (TIGR03067 family)